MGVVNKLCLFLFQQGVVLIVRTWMQQVCGSVATHLHQSTCQGQLYSRSGLSPRCIVFLVSWLQVASHWCTCFRWTLAVAPILLTHLICQLRATNACASLLGPAVPTAALKYVSTKILDSTVHFTTKEPQWQYQYTDILFACLYKVQVNLFQFNHQI